MSVSLLYVAIAIYLFLPIFLFVLGWVSPLVSVTVTVITIIGIYFALKKVFIENKGKAIPITIVEIIISCVFFILLCVFLGQGDLFPQDYDWHKHHAVYKDLLYYEWPVIYGNDSMLTYYLGQYLVPAAVGKLFHYSLSVMNFMIPVWNGLGICLSYLFIVYYVNADTKLKKTGVLFGIVFWGGCIILGQTLYKILGYNVQDVLSANYKWIDMERIRVHFASNYDVIYGAFQHVITPWLATSFFLGNKKNYESYVLLALPLMFTATFGFVYFAVLLVAYAIYGLVKEKEYKKWLKSIFSIGNLFLLPMTVVLLVYLAGNFMGDKPSDVGFQILQMGEYMDFFVIFIVTEFLGYSIFLFKRNRKNVLYYMVVIQLFIIPFISMGLYNDLCSRGSIPARFILMILCLDQLLNASKKDWCYVGVLTLMLTAALSTQIQMVAHVNQAIYGWNEKYYLLDDYKSFEGYAGSDSVRVDNAYNYFTLNYTESMFYKIMDK